MADSDIQLQCVMDLMRRLPPQMYDETLRNIVLLMPNHYADILNVVDPPLRVAKDPTVDRNYLLCDYNRDGDSYRSPWSNTYFPHLEDGTMPSETLRSLEISMNKAFNQYRELYYERGISSVYLWDNDHGFAGAIVIKNAGGAKLESGCWDSIHIIDVNEQTTKPCVYNLTSTILLSLSTKSKDVGLFNISGSLTRSSKQELPIADGGPFNNAHIPNIGHMIEDMEITMRNSLCNVYFGNNNNIVASLHSIIPASEEEKRRRLAHEVHTAIQNKANS